MLAAPVSASDQPADGASGVTGATVPLVAALPAGALPGIDVSHHQGPIDWSQVAAAGTRFAFAKATEGRNYVDPQYATNKAGAALSGVAFGAYHFAQPDGAANDAILEADHFVDVAQLEPGDLVPVLDIERTGGLSQAQVTQWILTWLNRVTERVGVRPMVYTSPHGWATRTGDTTAVADAGYSLLWVAHWNVASPTVPGANWSGNGWTFWQYGNCGTVPGIDGCVDVDWYEGGSFDPVTIPAPDDVAPTATFALPATPAEPLSISFSEIVHQVTPENAYVWIPSTGTYPALELTCRSGKGADVDCVSGNVRSALVRPLGSFVLGETYEAVVNPAIAPVLVVDRSANPVSTAHAGVRDAHRGRGGQPGDLVRLAHGLERGREGRLVRGGAPGRRDRLVRVRRRVGHLVHGRRSEPGQGRGLGSTASRRARSTSTPRGRRSGSRGPSTGSARASIRSRSACSAGRAGGRPTRRSSWTRSVPAASSSRTPTWTRPGASSSRARRRAGASARATSRVRAPR